jgi:hypothetical protein
MSAARKSVFSGNSGRTWLARAGAALVAGLFVGVGGGFLGLRILRGDAPPAPVPVEEPEPETPAPRRTYSGPRADGGRAGEARPVVADAGTAIATDTVAIVPDLIGRAEGDARRLLERAGFTLGDISFREADERLGTVLESYPVPGERVQLPATVNLILADRRRSVDTLPYGYSSDTTLLRADSARVNGDTLNLEDRRVRLVGDSLRSLGDSIVFPPDTVTRFTHHR